MRRLVTRPTRAPVLADHLDQVREVGRICQGGHPSGKGSRVRFDQYTGIPTACAPGTSWAEPATNSTRSAGSPSAASPAR
jgi:hypothetical protein